MFRSTMLPSAAALALLAAAALPASLNAGPAIAGQSADQAAVTVLTSAGERALTLEEIESMGVRQLSTRSPWEPGQLNLQGVLLSDVLHHLGLDDAASITVTANDDYSQVIPKEDWQRWPILLATREGNRPLTTRTQGPTRIVYPLDGHPELDVPSYHARWVWAIRSIDARPQ